MSTKSGESRVSPKSFNVSELFVQNALAKAHNCAELKLEKCSIKRINQDGENFCSDIYDIKVNYRLSAATAASESCEKQLVLKVLMPELSEIGSSEVFMYQSLLPSLDAVIKATKLMSHVKLFPNCLYVERLDREVYLMENLNALGFKTVDRCAGLDEVYARVTLEKIANFHAAGMVLQTKKPELVAAMAPSHFANGACDPVAKVILIEGTEFVAELLTSSWPDFKHIGRKMQDQLPHYNECIKQVVDPSQSKINTIVHGDLWLSNVLYKHDTGGQLTDAVFVDYQNCFWGTPAVDLYFFFYTSLKLSVLQTKRDDLLRHYYDKLAESLIGCEHAKLLPSYQTFLDEMERSEFFAYYAAVCEMPLCRMDKITSEGFNALTFTDPITIKKKREQLYRNERVKEALRYTLPYFDKRGVLDLV